MRLTFMLAMLFVVVQIQAQSVVITVSQANQCAGDATADLTAIVTGGVGPYTYLWNTGAATQTIFNQSAGTYSVTITDATLATANATVTMNDPAGIHLIIDNVVHNHHLTMNSNTGSIAISTSGGSGSLSYLWSMTVYQKMDSALWQENFRGGDAIAAYILGVDTTNFLATSQDINGLRSGRYYLTITDANGCQTTWDTTLVELNSWNDPTFNIDTTACFRDCEGSSVTFDTADVHNPILLYSSNDPTNPTWRWYVGYFRDSVIFPNDRAYWNDNNWHRVDTNQAGQIVNPTLGPCFDQGFNWLMAVDARGYSQIRYFTVTEAQTQINLSVTFNSDDNKCFGDQNGYAEAFPEGSYGSFTYRWSNNKTTQRIEDLGVGSYSVRVRDLNGCETNETGQIMHPPKIKAETPSIKKVDCWGAPTGRIQVTYSGGEGTLNYTWSNGATSNIADSLLAGDYYVVVTDQNNCKAYDTLTVTQPQQLQLIIDTAINVTCYGLYTGMARMHYTGGTAPVSGSIFKDEVLFDYFRPLVPNLAVGNYKVDIVDYNGCEAQDSFKINEPNAIFVSTLATDALCFGDTSGTINVSATGGSGNFTLLWNDANTKFIRNVKRGEYTATITDQTTGCKTNTSAKITEPDPIKGQIKQDRAILCHNDATASLDLDVWGGTGLFTYLWNTGATTEDIGNLIAGSYKVSATDANNCLFLDSFEITQPDSLILTLDIVDDASCYGMQDGSVEFTVSGGTPHYTQRLYKAGKFVEFSTGVFFDGLGQGNYSIELEDYNKCFLAINFVINEPAEIKTTITKQDIICYGEETGMIDVSVSGGSGGNFTILWEDGSTEMYRQNLAPKEYSGEVKDNSLNCGVKVYAKIIAPMLPPSIDYFVTGSSQMILAGGLRSEGVGDGKIEIENVYYFSPQTYELQDQQTGKIEIYETNKFTGHPYWSNLDTGSYLLTTISVEGCIRVDSIYLPYSTNKIEVPLYESFSPNGDGSNDTWTIEEAYKNNCEVWIYDKENGGLVFYSKGYNDPWNGKYDNIGADCSEGLYLYILYYDDAGRSLKATGQIFLKRKKGY